MTGIPLVLHSRLRWVLARVLMLGAIAGTGERSSRLVTANPIPANATDDPLPAGAIARLGSMRFRHGAAMNGVAFSPDGKILASGGDDSTIRLWDRTTGRELRDLRGHQGSVTALAFVPNGKMLASASWDKTVRLWDTATGKEVRRFTGHLRRLLSLAIAADGKTLASGEDDRTIRLWDMATGKELRQVGRGQPSIYDCQLLAFSPDGKLLAAATEGAVGVWEAATGKERLRLRHSDEIYSIAFAPEGAVLASADGDKEPMIHLWDTATGRETRQLRGHQGRVAALAFSPSAKSLASGDWEGNFRLWDLRGGKAIHSSKGVDSITSIAFAPDGKVVAVGSDDGILHLRDAATGAELVPPEGHQHQVTSVAFSPDGRTLFSGGYDRTIRCWDPATGRELRRIDGLKNRVGCLALSPDGAILAWGGSDARTIQFRDAATGKELRRFGEDLDIQSLAFSPDGKTLVSGGSADWMVLLWDRNTGKKLRSFRGEGDHHLEVAFAADGRTIAAASWSHIRLLDAATLREIRQFEEREENEENEESIGAMALAPDGRTLATAGWPGPVRLWSVAAGRELCHFEGSADSTSSIAFSPEGRTLAAAGYGGSVRLWELATGKERRRFDGHRGAIWSVAFAPDGRRLASGSRDTTVLVWDVAGLGSAARKGRLSARDLAALWADLAGEDAVRAYQAILTLAAAPAQALPFLRKHLRPAEPVRPETIARLIGDLGNDSFAVREKASQELQKLGETADPALRKALAEKPTLEVRKRIERIRATIDGRVHDADLLRGLRAMESLEWMDVAEVRPLLRKLAGGAPESRLTREAKAVLERLSRRAPAAREPRTPSH